jgi:IS30 family transposase
MSKKRPKLDSDDRIKIHACLERRMNVTAIAKEL